MHSTMKLITIAVLISIAISKTYQSASVRTEHGAKLRRDGVLNLYPFPRVGRSSYRTWQIPINDVYLDYEPAVKRQLYAFPRVGRAGPLMDHDRFESSDYGLRTDKPGMWFGPRLGRSLKNDDDEIINQNENDSSEPEQIETVHEERIEHN